MNFKRSLKNAKLFFVMGICLIIIGLIIFSQKSVSLNSSNLPTSPTPNSVGAATFAKVTRVFDGDTIEIEGGQKIRYIGIDATEVYPTRKCFSDEALAKNKELVLEKVVRLEKDVSETDKYGRLLRYVYADDIFVNDELVESGFAKVMTVLPDVKYKDQFLESEKYAKEFNLGLWRKCGNN